MVQLSVYRDRTLHIIAAVGLLLAVMIPLLTPQPAHAAQLTARKIVLGGNQAATPTTGASKASQTDVTYSLYDTIATTGNIGGMVVDFCSNSPIIGTSCTAPTGFDVNEAGLVLALQTGITDWAIDAATDTNTIVLSRTAASVSSGTATDLDFGSSGGSDGITNPSTACGGSPADKCTYYARVLTYATTAGAQGYTSATPGTHVDDGGIAISTANQLTITARVQEVLHFCVGTTDAASTNDCADITGTSIDLGVVDSNSITVTGAAAGLAMIRTNANSGAVIEYFAEQNTSSGKLKVAGATCSGVSTTDQCFNSAGTTATTFSAGTEKYGMTSTAVDTSNGSTTNVTRDANYDNSTEYSWDDTGTFDVVATSSTVIDDEMLDLKYAATAAATTPTGAYTVTQTWVAVATF